MTSVHHLQSKLKALKLGGMLLTLETRLTQAQKEPLGFLDFLEMLLEASEVLLHLLPSSSPLSVSAGYGYTMMTAIQI